jgi:hypothetical protein
MKISHAQPRIHKPIVEACLNRKKQGIEEIVRELLTGGRCYSSLYASSGRRKIMARNCPAKQNPKALK